MAYDKIIDSAKLDAAMTATADAIRAKTGGTANIPWDTSAGFASAIADISAGAKIATGTVTVSSNQNLSLRTLTVSGIGFKPSQIFFYWQPNSDGRQMQLHGARPLIYLAAGEINYGIYTSAQDYEEYDEEADEYYQVYDVKAYNALDSGNLVVTFTDDGFKITDTSDISPSNISLWTSQYHYIAIG